MIDSKTEHQLREIEPFPILKDAEFQLIVDLFVPQAVQSGKRLFKAGRKWKGLYYLVEGSVRLVLEKRGHKSTVIDTIESGGYLGQESLFTEAKAPFSAYSMGTKTSILHLPKKHIDRFLKRHPQMTQVMREYGAQKMIKDFLIQSPAFAYVPLQQIYELVRSLETKELKPGELLIRQDAEPDNAYIILDGVFRVYHTESPQKTRSIRRLGELVGEMGLVKKQKRMANVLAKTSAIVLVVTKKAFLQLFKEEQKTKEYINHLMQERMKNIPKIDPLEALWNDCSYRREDSGFVSLTIVCRYYQKKVSFSEVAALFPALETLESQLPAEQSSPNMSDMSKAAEALGFSVYPIGAYYVQLTRSCLPAITCWLDGFWVVIHSASNDSAIIGHPSRGVIELSQKEFIKVWNEYVMFLKPSN